MRGRRGASALSSMVSLVAEGAAKLVLAKRLVNTAESASGSSTHEEEVATVLDALLVTYFNPPEGGSDDDDDDDDDDQSAGEGGKDAMSELESAKLSAAWHACSRFFPSSSLRRRYFVHRGSAAGFSRRPRGGRTLPSRCAAIAARTILCRRGERG